MPVTLETEFADILMQVTPTSTSSVSDVAVVLLLVVAAVVAAALLVVVAVVVALVVVVVAAASSSLCNFCRSVSSASTPLRSLHASVAVSMTPIGC